MYVSTGKEIHFVKLPNFLSVESRPFDPDNYEDELGILISNLRSIPHVSTVIMCDLGLVDAPDNMDFF